MEEKHNVAKEGCLSSGSSWFEMHRGHCSEHSGHSGHAHFGIMMRLVKCAKMELIKEKVKEKFEETYGNKLDKIAELLVETMTEKMKLKKELFQKHREMEERIRAIFLEDENDE